MFIEVAWPIAPEASHWLGRVDRRAGAVHQHGGEPVVTIRAVGVEGSIFSNSK